MVKVPEPNDTPVSIGTEVTPSTAADSVNGSPKMAELSLWVPQFSPGSETVLDDVTVNGVAAAVSVSVVTVVVVVGEDPWSAQLIWMPSVVGLAGTVGVVVVVGVVSFVAATLLYAALETTSVRRSTKATPAVTNMLFELYVLFIRKASSDW